MVSNTGGGVGRSAITRASRAEHTGQGALILGVLAMACAVVPMTREVAWVPALPAVVIALVALGVGAGRKRFATAALMLGWFAFAYSFAMMLWG